MYCQRKLAIAKQEARQLVIQCGGQIWAIVSFQRVTKELKDQEVKWSNPESCWKLHELHKYAVKNMHTPNSVCSKF